MKKSSFSVSANNIRQLMSLEGPRVTLVRVKCTSNLPSYSPCVPNNKVTDEGPCVICTHTSSSSSSSRKNGVLTLPMEFLRRNQILSRLLCTTESKLIGDELTPSFCCVCLSTVRRLLDLREEMEEIESRLMVVLDLRTKLDNEADGSEPGGEEPAPIAENMRSDTSFEYHDKIVDPAEQHVPIDSQNNMGKEEIGSDVDVEFILVGDDAAGSLDDNETVEDTTSTLFVPDNSLPATEDDDDDRPLKGVKTNIQLGIESRKEREVETGFQCPLCPKSYTRAHNLRFHIRADHEARWVDFDSITFISSKQNRKDGGTIYHCFKCKKQIGNKASLSAHLRGVHRLKISKGSWGKQWTPGRQEKFSSICYFCFRVCNDLQAHLRYHTLERQSTTGKPGIRFQTPIKRKQQKPSVGRKAKIPNQCHICGKVYSLLYDLNIHIKMDHEGKGSHISSVDIKPTTEEGGNVAYKCPKCPKKYPKKYHVLRHMKCCHNISVTKTCPICNAWFKKMKVYQAHTHPDPKEPKKVTYVCQTCGKVLENLQKWHVHQKRSDHRNPGDRRQCHQCGKVLASQFSLNVHNKTCSVCQDEQRKCRFEACGQVFSSRAERDDHERVVHRGQPSLRCYFCSKTLSCSNSLEDHLRIHTTELPFRCRKCGKEFRVKDHRKKHVTLVCGTDEKGREEARRKKNEYLRAFRAKLVYGCDVCGKRYGQKAMLVSHMKREHC